MENADIEQQPEADFYRQTKSPQTSNLLARGLFIYFLSCGSAAISACLRINLQW